MYHFSAPKPSMKPPDEFELSLPRLCRPLVSGVEVPGGDIDRLGLEPGDAVPGDLESGGAYRCDEGLEENGRAVEVVFDGEDTVCVACDVSVPLFVVIVFGVEVALVAVVETWAVETNEVGEMLDAGLDLA